MNRLIAYLLDNLTLDFRGGLTVDQARSFLRDDESPEAKALLARLIEEGIDAMLVTLATTLQPYVQRGINADTMRVQLGEYGTTGR